RIWSFRVKNKKLDRSRSSSSGFFGGCGYVPPKYVNGGIYSRKYDVYSFGVLILQILSGEKTACLYGLHKNVNLLEPAYEIWEGDKCMDFMDPSLDNNSSPCKMKRCMQVALLRVQEKWEDRPSMLDVSSMLKSETEIVPTPKIPAFSINKTSHLESVCSEVYSIQFGSRSLFGQHVDNYPRNTPIMLQSSTKESGVATHISNEPDAW
ncbi:hypothetical protein MIMGU_mgv1a019955mg, partial [Erythranthe guttata]